VFTGENGSAEDTVFTDAAASAAQAEAAQPASSAQAVRLVAGLWRF
jgi:hypothetical protein